MIMLPPNGETDLYLLKFEYPESPRAALEWLAREGVSEVQAAFGSGYSRFYISYLSRMNLSPKQWMWVAFTAPRNFDEVWFRLKFS